MTTPKVHPTLAKLEEIVRSYEFPFALTGYIGPAPDGVVRLFPQVNLREYVEIAESAILHFDQPSETERATLYVDPSARVHIVTPEETTTIALMDDAGPPGDAGTRDCYKLPLEECVECKYSQCIQRQKDKGASDESAKKICDPLRPIMRVLCIPIEPPNKPDIVSPA